MYKVVIFNDNVMNIVRIMDNAWIPIDEVNTDYQAYLAWVAEGNTAEEWVTE